jgi:probable rRNA maturation factor
MVHRSKRLGKLPRRAGWQPALPSNPSLMSAIIVRNRQRTVTIELSTLQGFAEGAVKECLKLPARRSGVLSDLEEVSVALVSDRQIAKLHQRFLNEPGPTDVITFQHGEIVISAATARRQARAFRTSMELELRLYLVHGLLHLGGFDDKTTAGAAEMKRVQEKLVAKVQRTLDASG